MNDEIYMDHKWVVDLMIMNKVRVPDKEVSIYINKKSRTNEIQKASTNIHDGEQLSE